MEIWTHGPYYDTARRVDRYFEPHTREAIADWAAVDPRGREYEAWLTTCTTPIYMQESYPDIPGSIAIPKDALIARFGWWWTSTVAWEFGMALLEGRERISVYGVELQHETEYGRQLPCVAYYIGFARGAGIDVQIAESSTLCKAPTIYGYNTPTPSHGMFGKTRLCGMSSEITPEAVREQAVRGAWATAQYAAQARGAHGETH